MNIHDVNKGVKTYRKRIRVGRGTGSGRGKTSSRGEKGQASRAGWSMPTTFQGGQNPLIRRVPKRGFNNPFALRVAAVNVGDLDRYFEAGGEVNPESLRTKSLAKWDYDVLKILGEGELTKKLKVTAHRFSKTATEKIQKAGGEVTVIPGKTTVAAKKKAKKEAAQAAKK